MTTKELLISARELIADPRAWIQDAYSYFSHHKQIECYCGMGAVKRALVVAGYWDDNAARLEREWLAQVALNAVAGGCFIGWQDGAGRTHGEVLAAFDRAIEATS